MPLRKNGTTASTTTIAPAQASQTASAAHDAQSDCQPTQPTPARRLSTRKAGDKAETQMTKDDYWRKREERDIEKDHRISRQGMFQAALQSVGVLQLNTNNTLDSYMELVEKVAERGLQFANRQ